MTLKDEYEKMLSGAIKYPDDCSEELLNVMIERDDGIHKFQAQHELTIRKHGRTLIAVYKEDENGETLTNKNGKPLIDFVYSKGQYRKGKPDVLAFYPSQTVGYAINKLCDKIEAGEVEIPELKSATAVFGCFEDSSLKLVITRLDGKARNNAFDKYCCQLEDDAEVLLCFCPSPDGSFRMEWVPDALLELE